MVAVEYATVADVTAALPADLVLPSDVARLVGSASAFIDRVLLMHGAVYDVDAVTQLPTDTSVADAFTAATVAQVLWWVETGDERGFSSVVKSANPGGGPSFAGGIPRLAPDAADILRSAVDSYGVPVLQGPWRY